MTSVSFSNLRQCVLNNNKTCRYHKPSNYTITSAFSDVFRYYTQEIPPNSLSNTKRTNFRRTSNIRSVKLLTKIMKTLLTAITASNRACKSREDETLERLSGSSRATPTRSSSASVMYLHVWHKREYFFVCPSVTSH